MKKIYIICLFLMIGGCSAIDTYEIKDVSKKHIFRPEVRSETFAYSIHVEGVIDGEAEIYVLSPNADVHKKRDCSRSDTNKIKTGKVNAYYEQSIYYKAGATPYLYYLPCTAKKGHLKVRISFSEYLKKE